MLKVLLTISSKLNIHNHTLLKIISVYIHVHLYSKNPVNQNTAKASLTQLVNVYVMKMKSPGKGEPKSASTVSPGVSPYATTAPESGRTPLHAGLVAGPLKDSSIGLSPTKSDISKIKDTLTPASALPGDQNRSTTTHDDADAGPALPKPAVDDIADASSAVFSRKKP